MLSPFFYFSAQLWPTNTKHLCGLCNIALRLRQRFLNLLLLKLRYLFFECTATRV